MNIPGSQVVRSIFICPPALCSVRAAFRSRPVSGIARDGPGQTKTSGHETKRMRTRRFHSVEQASPSVICPDRIRTAFDEPDRLEYRPWENFTFPTVLTGGLNFTANRQHSAFQVDPKKCRAHRFPFPNWSFRTINAAARRQRHGTSASTVPA